MTKILTPHIDRFLKKHFGEGKTFSSQDVDDVIRITKHKFQYLTWVIRNVENGNILKEDIYKLEEYFDIFEKNKNKYPYKDINHYGKTIGVQNFYVVSQTLRDQYINNDIDGEKFIDLDKIKKLEDVGILYHGICEDYQVFELPFNLYGNIDAWTKYRNILGESSGGKIDICTIANFNLFNKYYDDYPYSSYFVLFNYHDKKSPYQFHYESKQFMDKNDKQIIRL